MLCPALLVLRIQNRRRAFGSQMFRLGLPLVAPCGLSEFPTFSHVWNAVEFSRNVPEMRVCRRPTRIAVGSGLKR